MNDSTNMRNVLIIAYDFPPIGGSGTLRTVKYAKYLPLYGWNPIVLTVEKDAADIEYADTSFVNHFQENLTIYRTSIVEPYDIYRFFGGRQKQGSRQSSILHIDGERTNFRKNIQNLLPAFLVPDTRIGWYPNTIRRARQIFCQHKIDVIYSTSPKNTAHMIAKHLSRKYRKPWVADFRDPWPAYYPKRPLPLQKLDEMLEKNVLSKATRITVAWPGILEDIIRRYTDFDDSKVETITNGFDEDDFKNLNSKKFDKFTISYAGVFYKERTPEPLFRGLDLLLQERSDLRKSIKILFIGISDPLLKRLIDKYNLSDIAEHMPHVPHNECMSYLLGSHLLFLNTFGNCVPGKLYEYIGLKKPILALVAKNTLTAEIVSATKSGVVIDPSNTEEIKTSIIKAFENYKKGNLKLERENDSLIYQYQRKRLTGQLAQIFNKITVNS